MKNAAQFIYVALHIPSLYQLDIAWLLQWMVARYSDRKLNDLLRSPEFEVAGLKWHVAVYPRGFKKPVSAAPHQ